MIEGFILISETWENGQYVRIGKKDKDFALQYCEVIDEEVHTSYIIIPGELAPDVIRTLVNELIDSCIK